MTRLDLLRPYLKVIAKMCQPPWPCPAGVTTRKVARHPTYLCCGVPGQGQVKASRCVLVRVAHFHSLTTQAAPSTPAQENSRKNEQQRTTSQLTKGLASPPQTGKQKRLESVQKKVNTMLAGLQDLFGMGDDDATEVLISCPVSKLSSQDLMQNLHKLKECGIQSPQIQRIPWIIAQYPDVLTQKLEKIKGPYLFREYHEGLGFCYLSLDVMSHYQQRFKDEAESFPNHPNRIYYLAERIRVPVELLTDRIGKPHKTLVMDIKRLDHIIDIFHRYGLIPEDFVKDLWVFEYSADRGEERFKRAAELGCTDLKPWMYRCSDEIFDRFCARYQTEHELLGNDGSVIDFLAERLQCDRSEMERAFQSNIIMYRIHVNKFNRVLNLLFSEGVTAEEIRTCMRIFQYSELRTAARIKELKEAGYFPFPLNIVCRTPERFKKELHKFKKRKYMEQMCVETSG